MKTPKIISTQNTSWKLFNSRLDKDKKRQYPLGRYEQPVLIRAGSTKELPLIYKNRKNGVPADLIEINSIEGCKYSNHKATTTTKLYEAGIPVPHTWNMVHRARERWINLTEKDFANAIFPLVAKLKIGSGGEGMVYIPDEPTLQLFLANPAELLPDDSRSKKLSKQSPEHILSRYLIQEVFKNPEEDSPYAQLEVRLHVSPVLLGVEMDYVYDRVGEGEGPQTFSSSHGIIYGTRKLMPNEFVEEGTFGRNKALGGKFSNTRFLRSMNRRNQVHTINAMGTAACSALKALNLDIGSVDLVYLIDGSFTILEVNSASGLVNYDKTNNTYSDRRTFQCYIPALKEIINQKIKNLQQ